MSNRKISFVTRLKIASVLILAVAGCSSAALPPAGSINDSEAGASAPSSSAHWVSNAKTIAELTQEADVIIRGRVIQAPVVRVVTQELPMMNESGTPVATVTDSMPFSDTLFEVMKTYSGAPPATLYVMQTGGVTEAVNGTYELADDPFYQVGEEYILFLVDISGDEIQAPNRELYRVVNPAGRYLITQDSVSNYAFENANSIFPKTLPQLEAEIAQALANTSVTNRVENALIPNSQIADGIEVSASNAKWANSELNIDVCFTIPNQNMDWSIRRASLTMGDVTVLDWGASLLELWFLPVNGEQEIQTFTPGKNFTSRFEKVPDDTHGKRCDRFSFSAPEPPNGPVKFSVTAIAEYPGEGKYCEHLARVQAELKTRGLLFTISCTEVASGSEMAIVAKPENMSQAEAEAIVFSEDWYTRHGPWEFVLEVSQLQ